MAKATYIRNPFPLPEVTREGVWKQPPILGNKVVPTDNEWSKELKTHERLFAHHTLNSIRKDNRLIRLQVPDDALDLALQGVYLHNKDSLLPKMYFPMQAEALGRKTWRVLRNVIRRDELEEMLKPPEDDPITEFLKRTACYRGPLPKRRVHPSNVRLNIPGPHAIQSNPGYSRKIDGSFYNI